MMTRFLILLIRTYQICISPILGNRCRFYPSCSAYTAEAINIHGPIKGVWLGLKRLSRCHPFHEGGVDPVPGHHCCEDKLELTQPKAGSAHP